MPTFWKVKTNGLKDVKDAISSLHQTGMTHSQQRVVSNAVLSSLLGQFHSRSNFDSCCSSDANEHWVEQLLKAKQIIIILLPFPCHTMFYTCFNQVIFHQQTYSDLLSAGTRVVAHGLIFTMINLKTHANKTSEDLNKCKTPNNRE